ncbi:hypothetical protein Tco_0880388 [Tanacetum coccineum]
MAQKRRAQSAMFEHFRGILREGEIDKRVQYSIEATIRLEWIFNDPEVVAQVPCLGFQETPGAVNCQNRGLERKEDLKIHLKCSPGNDDMLF